MVARGPRQDAFGTTNNMSVEEPPVLVCGACGSAVCADRGDDCVSCGRFFCGEDLINSVGAEFCLQCDAERRMRRMAGTLFSDDQLQILELVLSDLHSTVGEGYRIAATNAAERAQFYSADLAEFEDRLVDDLQQHSQPGGRGS